LDQVLNSHHFDSGEDLEKTLLRYAWLYNQHLPQKNLVHQTPVKALKRWQTSHPHLFVKNVRNHPGPDTWRLSVLRAIDAEAVEEFRVIQNTDAV